MSIDETEQEDKSVRSSKPPPLACEHSSVPPGAPGWVTVDLINLTIRTWQPYYETILDPDEALTIILNAGRLFDVIAGD